jgi:hypothetical protein
VKKAHHILELALNFTKCPGIFLGFGFDEWVGLSIFI